MAGESVVRVDDAIIIGGSFAGISAALQLARARRRVFVVDAGTRRNRVARHSHGFLGHDRRPPGEIIAEAKEQLLCYPTVTWIDDTAVEARALPAGDGAAAATPDFEVTLECGDRLAAHHLVLATGVVDELPDLPGLAERWGTAVFHCPYCHGFEMDGGPIAVLARNELVERMAQLLADWGPPTVFTQGVELDAITRTAIAARGVTVEDAGVVALEGDGPGVELRLADGRRLRFAGVFTSTHTRLPGGLAEQLGCELDEGSHGAFLRTNGAGETSVRGVYACGDNAGPAGSVATAVGDGARVGVAVHQSLVFR